MIGIEVVLGFVLGIAFSTVFGWLPWRRDLLAQSDFWYRQYRQADRALQVIALTAAEDLRDRAEGQSR